MNRLVDLEKRIGGLEELVGTPPVAGSGSAPASSAPLASLVGDLRDKVTLLDGPRYSFILFLELLLFILFVLILLLLLKCGLLFIVLFRLEALTQKIKALQPQIEAASKNSQVYNLLFIHLLSINFI